MLLLLISWSILGQPKSSGTKIVTIDSLKFEVEMTVKGKVEKEYYEFPKPVNNKEEALKSICSLRVASTIVPWPPGPAGVLTVAVWLMLVAASIVNPTTGSWYFRTLRSVALTIFRSSETALFVMKVMFSLHVLEAIYVLYLVTKSGLSMVGCCTWVALDLLLGLPVTMQARRLSLFHQKNSISNKLK